jgi:glycerol uptake facilitator-like aquaporin
VVFGVPLLDRATAWWNRRALICLGLFGRDVVVTGTPQLAINLTAAQGILVEGILTFFLVFVVHGTAVDPRARGLAGFAIGATITLYILFGGNESRTSFWSSGRGQFLA